MAEFSRPVLTSEQKNALFDACFDRDSYDALTQGADGEWTLFERLSRRGALTDVVFVGVFPALAAAFIFNCTVRHQSVDPHGKPSVTVHSLVGTKVAVEKQKPTAVCAMFCAAFDRLFQLEDADSIVFAGVRESALMRNFAQSTMSCAQWHQNGDSFDRC